MIRRPPRSTRTDTLFPYTTLFRSSFTSIIRSMTCGWNDGSTRGRPIPSIRLRASDRGDRRSEEHTSELQSLMRSSYAVFCLNKKNMPHIICTSVNELVSYNNLTHRTIPAPHRYTSDRHKQQL